MTRGARIRVSRASTTALLLLLGVGCAVTPESFDAKPQRVPRAGPGPVSIGAGGHTEAASVLLAEGKLYPMDLDVLSERLARLVGDSLGQAGTAIGPGGPSVTLRVVHIDYLFEGPCLLDYTVTLGEGPSFGLQSSGRVRRDVNASCGKALEAAIEQVAFDPRVAEYLTGG